MIAAHDDILYEVESVAAKAHARFGAMASTHEALGVALEEWHELLDAVRANELKQIEHEAIDLAAVLVRLARACRNGGSFQRRSVK
jgi:NTP pyrophosphatase (non-canonical NTP hydrolase)